MRIKKVSQTVPTSAQVVDGHSDSTTDSYSCNYVNGIVNYSLTEKRVGTWLGKPLYRKCYEGTLSNTPANNLISTNLDSNIKEIINYGGYIKNSYDTKIGLLSPSYKAQIVALADGTMRFDIADTAQNWTYKIYVEYTKTTDVSE